MCTICAYKCCMEHRRAKAGIICVSCKRTFAQHDFGCQTCLHVRAFFWITEIGISHRVMENHPHLVVDMPWLRPDITKHVTSCGTCSQHSKTPFLFLPTHCAGSFFKRRRASRVW